ncbi:FUSC family protein [Nocardioides sp. CPCC 205120]|uniref:FUSC family protein n=1 Tax=Nocardioides sp. CPCC 205120 TaxID=3406462 RepID=UPI003B50E08B
MHDLEPRRALTRFLAHHPALTVAAKAAVAAVVAWLVVQPWGDVADDYAYYAPLGAVVSVSTTVAQSVRATVQSVLAIALGATLAAAAMLSDLPGVLGLALVVGVGSLLTSWPRLGTMASWVPISALFVLIIGRDDPWHYVVGYLGLTTVGAAIGVIVNAAFPQLPLVSTAAAQDALRTELAGQLDDLADGLSQEPLPRPEEWASRRRDLSQQTRRMQDLVARATDAQQANWRAPRWRTSAERTLDQGRALDNLAFQVEGVTELLAENEHADNEHVVLGPELRPGAARALTALAAALRSVDDAHADPDEHATARSTLEQLATDIQVMRRETEAEYFAAGSLVVAMRRALTTIAPSDRDARPTA